MSSLGLLIQLLVFTCCRSVEF